MLSIHQAQFSLYQHRKLIIDQLTIRSAEFWVVVGGNGSGKSALAQALAGEIPCYIGEYQNTFSRIALLSFEQQQKIITQIFKTGLIAVIIIGFHIVFFKKNTFRLVDINYIDVI